MKRQKFLWGCLGAGLLLLTLIVLGGVWWVFRSQNKTSALSPGSPVFVFLLSPSSGAEVEAGDFVPVAAHAVAPAAIQSAELFVDGQSLGVVTESPESAAWTWQALPVGLHTLFARATAADGQVGQSQTLIVSVLAGDGLMQIAAGEGQTLGQVGAGFGVPADQLSAANPYLDPTQPLPDGQPVQVPVADGNAGGVGAPSIPLISWQFTPLEAVDKYYCYSSTGNGIWEKMPAQPFDFFQGADYLYTQFDLKFPAQVSVIQMQCWGWLGEQLKFLGEGETSFDLLQPPDRLVVMGPGFYNIGIPQIPVPEDKAMGGLTKTIPPPFALREPTDTADCTTHGHPLLAPFICNTLLNASFKEFRILEWEWQPKTDWTGKAQWLNEIDGYRLYEINPSTKAPTFLKEIANPSQKVTAVPLNWTPHCYGVRAFVNDPAIESSEMVTWCPGDAPVPQMVTTTQVNAWLTAGGNWVQSGDCDTYGNLDNYKGLNQKSGFGNHPGEVLVGSYIVDDEGEDCYRLGNYSGAVKISLPVLPPDAVIQEVVLRFYKVFIAPNLAELPPSCVSSLGKAKKDWSGLISAIHYSSATISGPAYDAPIVSLSEIEFQAEVTPVVMNWLKHPETNHGFILVPANAPGAGSDGVGECLSKLGNFALDIYYFAP